VSLSQVSSCLSCQDGYGLGVLLPHLAGVVVVKAELAGTRVCLWARARADAAVCRACGRSSGRVHSRYERRLADAAVGGRRVVIRLMVRRFFCGAADCPLATFAEQVEGLTSRYARRSPPLAAMLSSVAVALAGRAGARLAALLGMVAGRSSLLRLIGALPGPETAPVAVAVLGVDDFAFRRGRVYGTLLINIETGKPVDVLADREAGTLAVWLREHPGTEVICRDRAGAYAEGARDGAPEAIQVADRWHLWHNLAGHVEKAVARHRGCLTQPGPEAAPPGHTASDPAPDLAQAAAAAPAGPAEESVLARRTRQRYEQIQALRAAGKGIKPISRELGLARDTVRRFYQAATVDELLARTRDRKPSILDDWKPCLHQRWNAGHTNVWRLFTEIRAQGYPGSYDAVRVYLRPFRAPAATPPATAIPPKVRDLTSWLLRHPDSLGEDEKLKLTQAQERCPHLDALAGHITEFAKILTGRHGDRLDAWIAAVSASDLPDLHSFTRGLLRDYDAVLNGLTLPHSSGAVEGNVNRIKMIKRQMYGRAGFDLLRKRVLLPS
jgi:transposase